MESYGQEYAPEKESAPKYEVGDVLTVSTKSDRLRPRRCVVLEKEGEELLLSWGLRTRTFVYFRARHQNGRLQTGNQELLILSKEDGSGTAESRLYDAYKHCLDFARGTRSDVRGCADLTPSERQWVMQAITISRDLQSETERIEALNCLYSDSIGLYESDCETFEGNRRTKKSFFGAVQLTLDEPE